MKIDKSISLKANPKDANFIGNNEHGIHKKKEQKSGSTYAVNINEMNNSIFIRQKQLKKSAMKILSDAFAGELSIDKNIDEHLNRANVLRKEADEISKEVKRLQGVQEELKNSFGISDDSTEQKDLELRKKAYDISQGRTSEKLTEEEMEQLRNMGPMTEYQEAAFEAYKVEVEYESRIEKTNALIESEYKIVESIKLARLKTHPIVDAQIEADKVLDVADQELKAGLLNEAKDNIDDKLEEAKEKAEEVKEKEEIEEKRKEKSKESKGENKQNHSKSNEIELNHDINIDWEAAHKKIKELLTEQKMLSEDIKGIEVSEEL